MNDQTQAAKPESAPVAAAAPAPAPTAAPAPKPAPEAAGGPPEPSKAEKIAAHIRNGLSNGPIAQSPPCWDQLHKRLDGIVAAILGEL